MRQQRTVGALELDHLARQLVDAAAHRRVAAEDLGLDLVDVLLEPRHHRRVAVHHAVHDRVQDRLGTQAQQLRIGLHPVPHGGQVRRPAVADGDDEVGTDEDVDLPELDLLHLVEVGRRRAGPRTASRRSARASAAGGPRWRPRPPPRAARTPRRGPAAGSHRAGSRPIQAMAPASLLAQQAARRLRDGLRALDPLAIPIDRGVDHALLERGVRPRGDATPSRSRARSPATRSPHRDAGAGSAGGCADVGSSYAPDDTPMHALPLGIPLSENNRELGLQPAKMRRCLVPDSRQAES